MSVRVAVADDAALFREGVARLLADAGFEVTAKGGDAEALLEQVRADPPDVVIIDIRMPPSFSTEGLEAAQALRESHPQVGVLVLSGQVDPHYAMQLLDARGAGYLLKERVTDPEELADAVRRVAAGGLVIDPGVVAQALPSGSGLRGLEDRVAAAGGHLAVHSPPGGGTTIRAELPALR